MNVKNANEIFDVYIYNYRLTSTVTSPRHKKYS